ncbi:hypothetical protein [Mesorhizobium waimense]|uniref:hypothetical protein n=1 Tax=Mesorhizobium waimense TaxID=1300307 RepID=UPI0011C36730|nr:hypothetical protein [Mesorhizobium waimense]
MSTKLVCEEYFGGCPQCGEAHWANVHKSHWCFCPHHRVRWSAGENIFSSWHSETEADWRRNREMLSQYREVKPIEMGDPIPMAIEAESSVTALLRRIAGQIGGAA